MSKIRLMVVGSILYVLPIIAGAEEPVGLADGNGGPLETLLGNILQFSNNVLIPFIIGIGFLVFVWGMFQYFIAGGANDEKKEAGKSLMIYATLGFVLIIVFWGVVNLVANSSGLQGEDINDQVPDIPAPTRSFEAPGFGGAGAGDGAGG